jgi:hypothetical protein
MMMMMNDDGALFPEVLLRLQSIRDELLQEGESALCR